MHHQPYVRALKWVSVCALIGILVFGAVVSTVRVRDADARMRTDLIRQASLAAWTIDATVIHALSGDTGDVDSPVYLRLKRQLMTARALYPEVRFVYLMRQRPDGRIAILADSEDPASEDYSPPGEIFEEASGDLISLFSAPRAITEGPLEDRWGVWVSALVPILDPLRGETIALLGMDIDAGQWKRRKRSAAITPLAVTGALLGLWLVVWHRLRRQLAESQRSPRRFGPEACLALCAGLVLTIFFRAAGARC